MAVYQAIEKTQLSYHYDRYNLQEGQLIATNDRNLEEFFKKHSCFRNVTDETLIRLAPPLHMIKDPQDPYRMRKDDMVVELRSYGIAVDPCELTNNISMKLNLARKMLKRNFVTVLNKQGRPVFIDRLRIQEVVPAINSTDNSLSEPEEPRHEEYYKIDEDKDELKLSLADCIIKMEEDKNKKKKPQENKTLPKSVAASIDPIIDEDQINEGMDYADFLKNVSDIEYKRALISKEKVIKNLLDNVKSNETESFEQMEKEEKPSKPLPILDEDIVESKFRYLVEMTDRGKLFFEEISPEELTKIRDVKWSAVNCDIFENILRVYGRSVEYNEHENTKRWILVEAVRKLAEEIEDPQKLFIEINLLQKRHNEICKIEPSYRDFTHLTLKKRVTELSKFGADTWYNKEDNIKKLSQKIFQIAKLGLQIPDTEDKIDELLIKNKKSKIITTKK